MILILQVFALLFIGIVSSDNPQHRQLLYPFGDVRNCLNACMNRTADCSYRMEALPGVGFDNLRNIDMSSIIQFNYSECKTTNDGRFLIPDDILTIPVQQSRFDTYATVFEHWDDYVSTTSASINLGGSIYSAVSGKFGFEYQHVKEHQVKSEAKTTRTQMRTTLYKVILEPDAQLNPKFKNRLLDIAANIQSNNSVYAAYLCELLVRDYGTHVLRSIDAGAVVTQIDSVSSKYISDKKGSMLNLTSAAAASFKGKFSVGFSSGLQRGHMNLDEYVENRYYSQMISVGGPLVHPNMSLSDWEAGVLNSMVAIDRSGDPLHFVITPATLPELPSPILRDLVEYVYKGVEMYYSVNTHYGCTDPTSPNFNYESNLDDGSCSSPRANYTFGGVFQTCKPMKNHDSENVCKRGYSTKNPITGNYTCPEGYIQVKLHSGTVSHIKKEKVCDKKCASSGFLGWSRSCKCIYAWVDVLSSAEFDAYWCAIDRDAKKLPKDSGVLFGGLYTSKNANPITRGMTCPFHFYPVQIARDLKVCVSTQFQNAYTYSIPFGGFISCKVGNPLATDKASSSDSYSKHCPNTYKRFLGTVDEGCEINYCAQMESDVGTKPPRLPPFHSKPGYKVNLTQSLVIQGPYGEIWYRNAEGNWVGADKDGVTGKEVYEYLMTKSGSFGPAPSGVNEKEDDSSGGLSASSIAIVVSTTLLGLIILVALSVFGVCFVVKYKRIKSAGGKRYSPSSTYTSLDRNHGGIDDSDSVKITIADKH